MPRRQLPYLQREKSRHGRAKWFFRKFRGSRIRLPDEYGTPEFMTAYEAALKGAPARARVSRHDSGSLAWLVDQWRQSSDWSGTSRATRKQRENILQHVLGSSGDAPFAEISSSDIRAGRERRQNTPAAANNFLKTLRALFRWAKEAGHVESDPAKDVPFLKTKTKGFTPWTPDDVALYRKRWPLGTRQRVALEVLLNTGLRRSDAVRVGRQHVKDDTITINTFKSENGQHETVTVYIPVSEQLREALAHGPTGDLAFIVGAQGRPLTKESFGNNFRDWCKEAGLAKGKSAHGLRKLLASMVADNGGSEMELQALFGWVTNQQSLLYTKSANRKRLALQAAMKVTTASRED